MFVFVCCTNLILQNCPAKLLGNGRIFSLGIGASSFSYVGILAKSLLLLNSLKESTCYSDNNIYHKDVHKRKINEGG